MKKKFLTKISGKKAQEEMVGFALIIILVAIILLAFLGLSLNKSQKEEINNYEIKSFIQSFLQYTSTCDGKSLQNLIFECESEKTCSNEENSCKILNDTLNDILENSWPVGEDRPNKGYQLIIDTSKTEILKIESGTFTSDYKGANQEFSKKREDFDIALKIYF